MIKMPNKNPGYANLKYFMLMFALGCGIFLLSALPFAAQSDGIFYFYGDFNSQQVPFTVCFAGNFSVPEFDFNAGTGMDYLNAYSFYNLFSPFTLIFRIFPKSAAVYIFPFVIAIKFGFCAANAYIYISRFCRTDAYAASGAMLYTFSGYTMVTFVYHYLDALVFFPLLLAAPEAAVTEKRRGVFGIAVTVCAFTNYYIFGIEAIFLIIYFLLRLTDKDFRITRADFLCLAAETLLGLAAAGIVLVPAASYMLNSPRLGNSFTGLKDMLLYETPWRYGRIFQAIFIPSDLQGYTNFFPDFEGPYPAGSRWSSQALFIPVFGISGATAYISANRKSGFARLMAVCAVIALIPVLNSIFSLGSSIYYARWMFAPTLVMACMTARALENDPRHFKAGLIINGAAAAALTLFSFIFPIDRLSLWKTGAYYSHPQKYFQLAFAAAGLIIAALLLFKTKRDGQFPLKVLAAVSAAAFAFTEATVLFGMGDTRYQETAVTAFTESPAIEESEYGKRICTEENLINRSLIWGIPSTYIFSSIVPGGLYDYCSALEIVTGDMNNDYASQCLMSAKEMIVCRLPVYSEEDYMEKVGQTIPEEYVPYDIQEHYAVYENPNFIPIGFCYDSCISEEDFLSLDEETRKSLMLKTMVVEDTDAVSEYLEKADISEIHSLNDTEFAEECAARAKTSAHSFKTDGNSYTAEITLENPELVFFSVVYDKNFTVYVDGTETEAVKANFGFQAIPVPAGTHTVRAVYHSPERDAGAVCSAVGTSGLAVYIAGAYIIKRRRH